MYQPLVSIIIVVYNAHSTLDATIQSVLLQTYKAREIVVIDGGSTDGTLDILERHQHELAYFKSERDNGIYDAMNKGIKAASGEWLYFLGSDDVFMNPDVLTDIFKTADIYSSDMLYGNVRFRSNSELFGGSRTYRELIGKNINHQSIFYRKNLFDVVGYYNLRYKVLADYDLNLRAFQDEKILKKYVPIDVCLFNNKGGTSNITIDQSFFADKLAYFTEVDKLPKNDPLLQQYYFYTGFVKLMHNKNLSGLGYCLRAFTCGPRKLFYSLVFGKFILGYLGIGKKIKIV